MSNLKASDEHVQELRRVHAALHSAMDALIKDLNPNEAARLLILMDDRLTSLINSTEVDGVVPAAAAGKEASHPERKFKGTLPKESAAPPMPIVDAADVRETSPILPKTGLPRSGLSRGPGAKDAASSIEPTPAESFASSTVDFPLKPTSRTASRKIEPTPSVPPAPPAADLPAAEPPVEEPSAKEPSGDFGDSTVHFFPKFGSRRTTPAAETPPAKPELPAEPAAEAEEGAATLPVREPLPEERPAFAEPKPRKGVFQRMKSLLKPKAAAERWSPALPPIDDAGIAEEEDIADLAQDEALAASTDAILIPPVSIDRPVEAGSDSPRREVDAPSTSSDSAPASGAVAGGAPGEPAPSRPPLIDLPNFEFPGLELAARSKPLSPEPSTAEKPAGEPPVVTPPVAEPAEAKKADVLPPVSPVVTEAPAAAKEAVKRLHHIAEISAAPEILRDASQKTANQIELRPGDDGLDLVVKGLPKPLGTVRIAADGSQHVVYHPLFGLEIPGREPNRADLEMWLKAMGSVVVRVLENIHTRRRSQGGTKARAAAPADSAPPAEASGDKRY